MELTKHDARPSLDAAFAFFLECCGDEAEDARTDGSNSSSVSAFDEPKKTPADKLVSVDLTVNRGQLHCQQQRHQQNRPSCQQGPEQGAVPVQPEQPPKPRAAGHRESERRKRYRLEVAGLQDEIKELEARANRLRKFGGECERIFGVPTGFDKAVFEYNKLEKAKRRNAELKEALAEQQEASAALEKLFKQKLSTQDLDFLSEVEQQNGGGADYYEFLNRLVKVYARTPEVLANIGTRDTHSVFNSCNEDHNPVLGSSQQSTTNTPLPTSFHRLDQFLWRQVTLNINAKCSLKATHNFLEVPQVNCYGNRFKVVYSEALGGRSMDGMVGIRRFVEPHRVVLVISAHHTFPGSALVIREDGWVVLTDVSKGNTSANSAGTLLQTHFRIYTERQDEPLTPDVEALRDFVVKALSVKSRLYHQRVQYKLLQAAYETQISEHLHHELSFGCFACGLHEQKTG